MDAFSKVALFRQSKTAQPCVGLGALRVRVQPGLCSICCCCCPCSLVQLHDPASTFSPEM